MPRPRSTKTTLVSFLVQFTVAFMAVLLTLELVARTAWVKNGLTIRSVGNFDYQFEIKWFGLKDYVERVGGVDVILLGSSLVNTGLDPDVMAETYSRETGKPLRIFNFGVEGLSIAPNSVNAKILIDQYHPALLIYVTEMRDYLASTGLEYEVPFLSNPWVRYREGKPNGTGWLIDHSMFLQYFLPYRNWMRTDFPQTLYSIITRSQRTTFSGYEPDNGVDVNVNIPPDPNDPAEAGNFAEYGNFHVAESRLGDLKTILALGRQSGTKVIIVEMPVQPTFYDYIGGEEVHSSFQAAIASVVDSEGGIFIPAERCSDIPLNGRSNRWHLNYIGAPVFSHCLGQQLIQLGSSTGLDSTSREGNASP